MFSGRTQPLQFGLVWLFILSFWLPVVWAHDHGDRGGLDNRNATELDAAASGYHTLDSLFEGNRKFRDAVTTAAARRPGRRAAASVVEPFTEDCKSDSLSKHSVNCS